MSNQIKPDTPDKLKESIDLLYSLLIIQERIENEFDTIHSTTPIIKKVIDNLDTVREKMQQIKALLKDSEDSEKSKIEVNEKSKQNISEEQSNKDLINSDTPNDNEESKPFEIPLHIKKFITEDIDTTQKELNVIVDSVNKAIDEYAVFYSYDSLFLVVQNRLDNIKKYLWGVSEYKEEINTSLQ